MCSSLNLVNYCECCSVVGVVEIDVETDVLAGFHQRRRHVCHHLDRLRALQGAY